MPEATFHDALTAIDSWPVPHAAAAIVHSGSVVASHGLTDRIFRLASISKVLTAWACMIAIEEGSCTLEDACGPPGSTLRHCLAHASGYGFDSTTAIMGVGKRRVYSNTGIEAAATHVSERTGITFGDYISEAIFEPLGMGDTSLRASAAYAIFSTVQDMTAFIKELMHPTLLSSPGAAQLTTIQYPELSGVIPGLGAHSPNPWGLGIEIRGDKHPHWTGLKNSPQTFGHFGGSGTMMWVDPVLDLAVIALTDRNFDEWSAVALQVWPSLSDAVIAAADHADRS